MDNKEQKLKYEKETVLHYLHGVEHFYNEKYVKKCNDIKKGICVNAAKEHARMYSDMKAAIQHLIIDFEKDFE